MMKTIEFQKESKIKDSIYLIIDGEKHLMRHQTLRIQVDDEKSFKVSVKHGWDSSSLQTFEAKDDMTLHISRNWKLTKLNHYLSFVAIFAILIPPLFGKGLAPYIITGSIILSPLIFYIIKRKEFLYIQENVEK